MIASPGPGMMLLILLGLAAGVGCSGDHPRAATSASKSNDTNEPPVATSSRWTTSADGKLSLRVVVACGPIGVDEPVWVRAELRNETDESLAVLKPFGDPAEAMSAGFAITGPDGKLRYAGPPAPDVPAADSFTYLAPAEDNRWAGDSLPEWLRLSEGEYPGLDAPGQYLIRYTYRASPRHREAAGRSGIISNEDLWTGEIRTGPVAVTKVNRSELEASRRVQDALSVRIPEDAYRFSLAEAAAGVRFDYDVVVRRELEAVIPHPQDIGGAGGGGPSRLMPFETITGGGQSYCECDVGAAPPVARTPLRVERATYSNTFFWDGRNWGGPSDTGMAKGDPFPPGTYALRVRLTGEIVTPEGRKPCVISNTAKIILTP